MNPYAEARALRQLVADGNDYVTRITAELETIVFSHSDMVLSPRVDKLVQTIKNHRRNVARLAELEQELREKGIL